MKTKKLFTLLLLPMFCFAIGCGGREGGPVAGNVKLGDKPLTGAAISLYNGKTGTGITCELDENGGFQTDEVLPPGVYQVSISPAVSTHQTGAEGMPQIPKLPKSMPKKYTLPNTSGLTASVKTAELNEFTFELERK